MKTTIDKIITVASGLVIGFKKADENLSNLIFNNIQISGLNERLDIVSGLLNTNQQGGSGSVQISDLVALGILPKQISEFTDDDIGTIVSIPYTDESGNIAGPIEFEVVGVNHHKDINDESKPTITLMTKNTIRYAGFDAKEPSNPDTMRAECGNPRWSVSNIRQWLNSEGAANSWFTPQHEYDEAPTADKVNNDSGAYADDPGFLAGFSDEVKQHFATVRNKTILCNADKSALSKDFEETEDKVFLPSHTEMGFGNLDDNNPEGSHLAQKFIDENSRVKQAQQGKNEENAYWMRSVEPSITHIILEVESVGMLNYTVPCNDTTYWLHSVAPLIVLC